MNVVEFDFKDVVFIFKVIGNVFKVVVIVGLVEDGFWSEVLVDDVFWVFEVV